MIRGRVQTTDIFYSLSSWTLQTSGALRSDYESHFQDLSSCYDRGYLEIHVGTCVFVDPPDQAGITGKAAKNYGIASITHSEGVQMISKIR